MPVVRLIGLAALAVVLGGCQSAAVKDIQRDFQNWVHPSRKAEEDLAAGVRSYENANYQEASRLLQASLGEGLAKRPDQIRAHKYLAFIHCVSGRTAQCRDEFRQALALDPSFDLAANEAGHPMWGPVFRSVKAQVRGK